LSKTLQASSENFSDLTLHIVLATMPERQEAIFNKCVVDDFYGKYRDNAEKYLNGEDKKDYWYSPDSPDIPVIYNPLRFYIMGNYDIAYISLIDNFKFAQRVFEPQLFLAGEDNPELFAPHTFQSFSGITHPSNIPLRRFFAERLNSRFDKRQYFLSITNLKLNNGFLIGNGNFYLQSVIARGTSGQAGRLSDHAVLFMV